MTADEKLQKLLEMQEQGESIDNICKALELGTSRALSNLANRKGYRFDKTLKKYVPKECNEKVNVERVIKTIDNEPKESPKSKIERLEKEFIEKKEKLKELQILINEKEKRIKELEKYIEERPLIRHNERGAGRKERLSDVEKESIKMYRLQGKTIKELSVMYSCSVGLIHKIINEKKDN